jgi:hypothetical protein
MVNGSENVENCVPSGTVLQEKGTVARELDSNECFSRRPYYDLLWDVLNGDYESEIEETIGSVREGVGVSADSSHMETDDVRIAAYQLITCPDANVSVELKIDEAFEVLGLPRDASLRDVRQGFIALGRKWHPDLMRPENEAAMLLIFGVNGNSSWEEVVEVVCADEGVSDEDNDRKRAQYAVVKGEMVRLATEKLSKISCAYHTILSSFSSRERNSLDGFEWIDVVQPDWHFPGSSKLFNKFQSISLECGAEIQKKERGVRIAYEPYYGYQAQAHDMSHSIDLRGFFAWLSCKKGGNFSSSLLSGIKEGYGFNDDQIERLRIMLLSGESAKVIFKVLEIDIGDSYKHGIFLEFIDLLYNGPHFSLTQGLGDFILEYSLGVEVRDDGGMVFTYDAQEDYIADTPYPSSTQFTPQDVKVMTVMAFGKMLASEEVAAG